MFSLKSESFNPKDIKYKEGKYSNTSKNLYDSSVKITLLIKTKEQQILSKRQPKKINKVGLFLFSNQSKPDNPQLKASVNA